MTAISPYAPPRRNSLLHHPAPGPRRRRGSVATTAGVGLLLVVIRYWKNAPLLRRLFALLQERFPNLSNLLQGWFKQCSDRLLLLHHSNISAASPSSYSAEETAVVNGEKQAARQHAYTKDDGGDEHHFLETQLKLQRSVLCYWFGRYTPNEAQKKLWMIADQSVDLRDQVDRDVTDKFAHLLDRLVVHRTWQEWCNNTDRYGYQGKIAAIVVLDQFSRHIGRCQTASSNLQQLEQSKLDHIALQIAERFVEEHADEMQSGMIPIPMQIFALMPFRHANRLETVRYVQQQVETMSALLTQDHSSMLGRFRKATNRRLAVLQDEQRRTADPDKTEFSDQDILECFPFHFADSSALYKHPVHRTIRAFLADRGIHPAVSDSDETTTTPIVVSLSGGVDSMVIAAVLADLNRSCGYQLDIVAVHLDYANRPESAAEADYVRRFCKDQHISFRCRRIEEVTRGVTVRDAYERTSRDIRYTFYRDTVQECLKDRELQEVGVVLGHHRGDLRENVLSNAHKGCGPLDLSGMTAVSQNDGVTLYRPLLPLEKTAVYDYAHKFGVPYLKDTTPHWSTRGKLRNKLLPLLEEIYGEGSMSHLSTLAVDSDECRDLVHDAVLRPFLDHVAYKPMGIQFPTQPWKDQGLFFWKFVLREMLHSAGMGMFSDKSVVAFLERVCAAVVKEGWLQCRKDYGTFLRKDGTVFVFFPDSFPWRKTDAYPFQGRAVNFDEEVPEKVGPWEISVRNLRNSLSEREAEECLETRAIFSMEDLMEGSMEYHVEIPTLSDSKSRPLVFTKFTKATRPKAWKRVDIKIQEALPILGNDEESLKALDEGRGDRNVARVTLRLESTDRSLLSL